VQTVAALGSNSSKQQRKSWFKLVRSINNRWRPESNHYSKQSATCDLVHMPKALLPRMASRCDALPEKWPYLSQSTIHDVYAMCYIRDSGASSDQRTALWRTLQSRLKQYATTGAGTVAEAIVANDNWWNCHNGRSGGKSKAKKRRHSKRSALSHTESIAA
jgi:hypothetical protein